MRTESLAIYAITACVLLWITSGASIAFGFDRIENHDLHIDGAFFLFLGVFRFVVGVYLFTRLVRIAWSHNRSNDDRGN